MCTYVYIYIYIYIYVCIHQICHVSLSLALLSGHTDVLHRQ